MNDPCTSNVRIDNYVHRTGGNQKRCVNLSYLCIRANLGLLYNLGNPIHLILGPIHYIGSSILPYLPQIFVTLQ